VTTEENVSIHTFDSGDSISNIGFSDVQDYIYYAQPLPSNPEVYTVRLNNWTFDAPLDIFQIEANRIIKDIAISPDQNRIAYTV
ncbi:hypothetical protein, partial [Pseudomonas sp. 2995-1]|uniref:hypothetical protein n=1 Tax=Pseudomonas sp. 2995-1 TaxID=1712679 RepID=UPI001C49333D